MESRCRGQDGRNLSVELYKCPHCGTEIEMFSNENKVKCYNCGGIVRRERGDK